MQLNLNKVLYVPNLSKNLLSVAAMTQIGADVLFDEGKCITSKNERKSTTGHLVDSKLYIVNTDGEAHIASTTSFGHLNYSYIDRLIKGKFVEGISCSSGGVNRECEACAQGKTHRIPFPKKREKETHQPLQLAYSDLCGPMNVDSVGGSKYVLTFTDDYTRYVTACFIKSKSEVLSKFVEYVTMMEKGIAHQLTNPYTPEQNGVSERLNRTLVESARSMLIHAKMPLKFWAEAVNTAVYLHNWSPTSALKEKTPFESWFGKKPNVSIIFESFWKCLFCPHSRSLTKEA